MPALNLKLYHSPTCGYCHWVREAAEDLKVAVELVDVRQNPEARARLYEFRGRATVPVLGIDEGRGERLLGESRDIIAYLRKLAAGRAA